MSRGWLRLCELIGLLLLGSGLLGLAAYMVHVGRLGEAFGAVITTIPLVIQSIRGIGQAQAMQSMADNLARSRPVKGEEE
ncbi:MAG: hypothetical protein LW689_04390 [Novosphingobium sp.]|jgi:hypothetical protein|nr:hypothetical protein [Novosphingobium sp.]MCE2842023.1 hypothetical protein [Novosphingobium sp.]